MNKQLVNVRNGVVWFKNVLGEMLIFELDTGGYEYLEIVNAYEIPIGIDKIYDVWSESHIERVPKKKR